MLSLSKEAAAFYWEHVLVNGAYLTLLGRTPSGAGFRYYMERLSGGALQPPGLMHSFINSPEYINRLAGFGCTFPLD